MAGATVRVGKGSKVTFQTSGYTQEFTAYRLGGLTREMLDVTHMESADAGANQVGNMEYMGHDLVESLEITLEGHFNPDKVPPVHGAKETIDLEFKLISGDSTKSKWSGTGQVSGFSGEIPKGLMTNTLTIKFSGPVTITAAT